MILSHIVCQFNCIDGPLSPRLHFQAGRRNRIADPKPASHAFLLTPSQSHMPTNFACDRLCDLSRNFGF